MEFSCSSEGDAHFFLDVFLDANSTHKLSAISTELAESFESVHTVNDIKVSKTFLGLALRRVDSYDH